MKACNSATFALSFGYRSLKKKVLPPQWALASRRHAAIQAKADISGSSDCTLCRLETPCEKVCGTCLSHDVTMCAALNLTFNFVALQIFVISKRLTSKNLGSPLLSILKFMGKRKSPKTELVFLWIQLVLISTTMSRRNEHWLDRNFDFMRRLICEGSLEKIKDGLSLKFER